MTLDRNAELSHLSEADTHIADGERRVAKQEAILEKLRQDGHDTTEGCQLLQMLNETLEAMRQHRVEIVNTLARIDSGLT